MKPKEIPTGTEVELRNGEDARPLSSVIMVEMSGILGDKTASGQKEQRPTDSQVSVNQSTYYVVMKDFGC